MSVMDLLGGIADVLDMPGSYLRGLLAGKPGERASGRDLLEEYGLVGANTDQGYVPDAGDMAGFGVDMLLDPLNLIGLGAAGKTAKAASKAKTANKASQKLRALGAMPAEIVEKLHPSMLDEAGKPKRMLHGTRQSGIEATDLDPAFAGKQTDKGFLGKGTYFTESPDYSNYYTYTDPVLRRSFPGMFRGKEDSGSTLMAYLDSRNPLQFDYHSTGHIRDALEELQPFSENAIEAHPGLVNDALRKRGHDAVVATGPDMEHFETMVPRKEQIYAPYIAPALQDVPDMERLLELLAAYNASKTPLLDL